MILALSIVTSFRDNATSCELFRLSFIGRCLTHSIAEATQANRWLKCQPSSYVRLEAYGFFGLSEGA